MLQIVSTGEHTWTVLYPGSIDCLTIFDLTCLWKLSAQKLLRTVQTIFQAESIKPKINQCITF